MKNNYLFSKIIHYALGILAGGLMLAPQLVFAQAVLYLAPESGGYKVGEVFSVLLSVNTGGQAINAASGQLNFDNTRLEVQDMGYTKSVFSLWTEEPKFSNEGGVIRFSGGLPSPGFTGASGSILRVTFRAKASGQAPIVFTSGGVLANDGKGTNILDNFKGGLYTISPATEKTAPAGKPKEGAVSNDFSTTKSPLSVPVITDWPKTLEAASTLKISGLGYPDAKVVIYIQKGSAEPEVEEQIAGPDGRFNLVYSKLVESGLYRIWAKNVSGGQTSGSSESVTVEVTAPLFFRVGTLALNYISIIVTLIALLFFAIVMLGWMWMRIRKWRAVRGKEISEAEKALHLGFDKLKEGLQSYMEYLGESRSKREIEKKEAVTKVELKKELEDIERTIEKEIEDIRRRGK